MKETVVIYYAAIVVAVVGFLACFAPDPPRRPTATECGLADITPDMSPQDRVVCRQLRHHRL